MVALIIVILRGQYLKSLKSKVDNAVMHISRDIDELPLLTVLSNLSELARGDPSTMVQRFVANEVSRKKVPLRRRILTGAPKFVF